MNTSTLSNAGVNGSSEAALGWFLLIVSLVVVAVIIVLVLAAALRRRPIEHDGVETPGEMRWITIGGIVVPVIILTVSFLLTIGTINAVGAPPGGASYAALIDVTGHQWWWEVTYHDSLPQDQFTTANEIHIPVGEPVRFSLATGDVIHSFWVPALAGKVDLIPGEHNTLWLEAKKPGVYMGPCGEYCGTQHANMRVTVVAESPDAYHSWLQQQRRPAPAPAEAMSTGFATFAKAGCGTCHTIRGTSAGGGVGPDLTHIASRRMLAAGAIENTEGGLAGWITGAQGIKPGSDMPNMAVAPRDLAPLIAYLRSLQ
ncbi:MAG TPA: cytochrome c oxidase subunit II [Gemmatimonadaceae bacterium]|nr:cytochrome c oxidase subunit II [Gemmatimonadaceae bacterium]